MALDLTVVRDMLQARFPETTVSVDIDTYRDGFRVEFNRGDASAVVGIAGSALRGVTPDVFLERLNTECDMVVTEMGGAQ